MKGVCYLWSAGNIRALKTGAWNFWQPFSISESELRLARGGVETKWEEMEGRGRRMINRASMT